MGEEKSAAGPQHEKAVPSKAFSPSAISPASKSAQDIIAESEAQPLPPGCPPIQACDGPITLFRMSATARPSADDCLTAYEAKKFVSFDGCRRRSLSSYLNKEDAERLRRRVPHFSEHQICKGVVPSGAGVHMSTPSAEGKSHWSWWPQKGVSRHTYFTVEV